LNFLLRNLRHLWTSVLKIKTFSADTQIFADGLAYIILRSATPVDKHNPNAYNPATDWPPLIKPRALLLSHCFLLSHLLVGLGWRLHIQELIESQQLKLAIENILSFGLLWDSEPQSCCSMSLRV